MNAEIEYLARVAAQSVSDVASAMQALERSMQRGKLTLEELRDALRPIGIVVRLRAPAQRTGRGPRGRARYVKASIARHGMLAE